MANEAREPTEEMKRMARLERFAGRHYGRIIFYGSAFAAMALAKIWEPRAGMILFCIAFLSLAQEHDAFRKKLSADHLKDSNHV